jgi:polyisoprenoid-binding protein YceI
MESERFPEARFTGSIIEQIDFRQDGVYTVRAKGQLSVHGVSRERIIKSTLRIKNGRLYLHSDFSVLLDDHDINIPKIVNQKIAEEINIHIEAELAQI